MINMHTPLFATLAAVGLAGAVIATHEMVLFEWLHDCRHPRFRDLLALVKAEPVGSANHQ